MWEKIPEVAEIMLEGDEIDGLIVVGGFAGWDFLNPNVAPEVESSAKKMAALIAKNRQAPPNLYVLLVCGLQVLRHASRKPGTAIQGSPRRRKYDGGVSSVRPIQSNED